MFLSTTCIWILRQRNGALLSLYFCTSSLILAMLGLSFNPTSELSSKLAYAYGRVESFSGRICIYGIFRCGVFFVAKRRL